MAILFIVDTAPSMGIKDCPIQTTDRSPCISRLDCAKACVETFVRRHRQHPPQFLLVTTSRGNAHVNIGWGASVETFERELKMLKVSERNCSPPHQSLNSALSIAFQLLSHQRLKKNVDNFGLGRQPWAILPASVILLTDGSSHMAAGAKIQLPAAQRRDDFTCNAPFRWDQRMFTINISSLAMPNPLAVMTDATGGRWWQHSTLPGCLQSMDHVHEELVSGGVVVRLKSEDNVDSGALGYLGVRPTPFKSPQQNPCKQAGKIAGHWPIPEEFWCDRKSPKIPPRFAHPTLIYRPIIEGPNIQPSLNGGPPPGIQEMDFRLGEKFDLFCSFGLPIDWYQLGWMRDNHRQSPPLKAPLPEQQQNWKQRYAIYSNNSGRSQGRGAPLGILMKTESVWCLALLPYNYGDLSVLLQKSASGMGGMESALSSYVKQLPSSHHIPLARALTIATHPARNPNTAGQGKGNQGGMKPLRTNKACAMLLRLLAHASSAGGDAGLSEGFKEWQKRQAQHAESDDQRMHSAFSRIVSALPKRTSLLYHEQQSKLWLETVSQSQFRLSTSSTREESSLNKDNAIEPPDVFSKPPSAKLIGLTTFEELCALPISELMPRWNQISKRLYGGSGCDLFTKYAGMFAANDEPCAISISPTTLETGVDNGKEAETYNSHEWSGLDIGGIGFRRYACVPAQDMSSFYPALSKMEVLRNPTDESVMDMQLDKKQELEKIWRDRMSGNFSNPYASGKKNGTNSRNSDGLTDDGESFLNEDVVSKVVGGKEKASSESDGVFSFKDGKESSTADTSQKTSLFDDSMPAMTALVADTPILTSSFQVPEESETGSASTSTQATDAISITLQPSSSSISSSSSSSSKLPSLKLPRADLHRTRKKRAESLHMAEEAPRCSSPSSSPVSVATSAPETTTAQTSDSTNNSNKRNRVEVVNETNKAQRVAVEQTQGNPEGRRSISPTNMVEDYSNLVLPEGWIVAYSKRNQKYYFFNTVNNTSLWEPPKGTALKPIN